jgi:hypothetical protein
MNFPSTRSRVIFCVSALSRLTAIAEGKGFFSGIAKTFRQISGRGIGFYESPKIKTFLLVAITRGKPQQMNRIWTKRLINTALIAVILAAVFYFYPSKRFDKNAMAGIPEYPKVDQTSILEAAG